MLGFSSVDWEVVGQCMVELPPMILIVVIDCLLKLAGSEKALETDLDFDEELKLFGYTNIFGAACISSPAYTQLKFNVLNFGVTHSASSRTASYICSAILAIFFFAGEYLINFLPRFFIGGLVIFAGLGFLVENLLDARKHMSKGELFVVYAIFVVNIFLGLLVAVMFGVVLAAIIFAVDYSKQNDIKDITSGSSVSARRIYTSHQNHMLTYLVLLYK